jgi:Tol biopolymer transport system component
VSRIACSIYVTSAYNTDGSLLYSIPTDADGGDSFVYDPKVSPDGTKIAFRYMTNSNFQVKEGTVWVMNFDGTDPHQLVYTPDYVTNDGSTAASMQIYNDLAWSPDGQYILVAVGGTTGDVGSVGVSDVIYAVPSDSRGIALNDNGDNGIIKIRTYYNHPDSLTDYFEPYTGTITWLN